MFSFISVNLGGNELRMTQSYSQILDIINKHNDQIAINRENVFLFFCAIKQDVPMEMMCEIAGNLIWYPIDLI